MTKEEIQALIDATIAGQGSAIDAGGKLPAILSGILALATAAPEPQPAIVIEGTQNTDDNTFTPNDPAYTYEVVKNLILAGRAVFVKYYNDMSGIDECDAAVSITDNGIGFGPMNIALLA